MQPVRQENWKRSDSCNPGTRGGFAGGEQRSAGFARASFNERAEYLHLSQSRGPRSDRRFVGGGAHVAKLSSGSFDGGSGECKTALSILCQLKIFCRGVGGAHSEEAVCQRAGGD